MMNSDLCPGIKLIYQFLFKEQNINYSIMASNFVILFYFLMTKIHKFLS